MRNLFGITAVLLALVSTAHAQTLTTAETIGKQKKVVFLSANALSVRGFATLKYNYGQFLYGLTDRADLYVGPAFTTVFGRTQMSIGIGTNTNILKGKIISVSTYNLISIPITSRDDASTLIFSSQVISRNLKIKDYSFSGYTGYSMLIPLGHNRADKLFTPPRTFHFVPLGVMLPVGKRLAIFAEYNHGNPLRTYSGGVAISP